MGVFYGHFFRSRSEWFDIAVVALSSDSRRESPLFEFSPQLFPSIVILLFCEGPISPNVQTLLPLLGLGSAPLNLKPGGYFISIFKFLAADSELEITAILREIFWPETASFGAVKDKPKGALEIFTE